MKKIPFYIIGWLILIVLSACQQDHVTNEIYEQLEATVALENDFEKHQQHIYQLEKKDIEIYEELIHLGTDDYDKIKSLSEEAIELLNEREVFVRKERESIEKSKEAFETVKPLIGRLDNQVQKKQVEKLYQTMMARYETYEKAFMSYMDSIQTTKELYQYFQKKEYREKEMYQKIEQVNQSYETVSELYNTFNDQTKQFNELKQSYYDEIHQEEKS